MQPSGRISIAAPSVIAGLALELAGAIAEPVAKLVAGMVVLTWRTAYAEAIRVFERGGSAKKVNAAFLSLIDRGFAAMKALETSASKPSARR